MTWITPCMMHHPIYSCLLLICWVNPGSAEETILLWRIENFGRLWSSTNPNPPRLEIVLWYVRWWMRWLFSVSSDVFGSNLSSFWSFLVLSERLILSNPFTFIPHPISYHNKRHSMLVQHIHHIPLISYALLDYDLCVWFGSIAIDSTLLLFSRLRRILCSHLTQSNRPTNQCPCDGASDTYRTN